MSKTKENLEAWFQRHFGAFTNELKMHADNAFKDLKDNVLGDIIDHKPKNDNHKKGDAAVPERAHTDPNPDNHQ